MNKELQQAFDVLVIGGGPAGIAAAVNAAESGARAGIVDDNETLGGQIWRNKSAQELPDDAAKWYVRLQKAGVVVLSGKRVFNRSAPGVLLAEGNADLTELRYHTLVLATGARERFIPFPGWTLPNVLGAGGLQAMVKSGLPIQGKRVVIAGTGPLLLAVAAYLKEHGAEIIMICEQASLSSVARFGLACVGQPAKIFQALELRTKLRGVPFLTSCWVLAAHGDQALESITVWRARKSEKLDCDYLACGFHLVPNIELAQLLGCEILDGFVRVDDLQRTTVDRVFCAGEPTGIGGVEQSLIEGQIAGLAAAGKAAEAQASFGPRQTAHRFTRALEHAFHLRPELKSLPSPDTLVCRCEDVPYSRLRQYTSWRSAKLHTRCGMGPCQGRVCGPATQILFGWNPDSVRPPVFPVRLESLAGISYESDSPQLAGGLT